MFHTLNAYIDIVEEKEVSYNKEVKNNTVV